MDLNDNIDMQLLVRRKPFKDEKQQAINDVDADSDQEPREKNFETEFLGGEAGSDASEVDELEDDVVLVDADDATRNLGSPEPEAVVGHAVTADDVASQRVFAVLLDREVDLGRA